MADADVKYQYADASATTPAPKTKYAYADEAAPDPSNGQHLSVDHENLWERFKDNANNAARETVGVNQAVTALTGKITGDPDKAVQDERDYREQYAAQTRDDPWNHSGHKTAEDFVSDASHGVAALAGNLVGGLPNPINYLAPGGSTVARIAGQSAINGATDVIDQAMSLAQGTQDSYDWKKTAMALGLGAIFGAAPIHGRATDIQEKFNAGATAEEILKDAPDLDPKKVEAMVEYRDNGGEGAKFVDETPAAEAAPEAVPAETTPVEAKAVVEPEAEPAAPVIDKLRQALEGGRTPS
jgi:uncharacterized protein (DUF433 family)